MADLPTPVVAAPMEPVAAGERIGLIDILRGMALFGILAANVRGFFAPESVYDNARQFFTSPLDQAAQAFIDLFVQGKFVTLFASLFGIGFAIQMTRAAQRGRSISFYPRRLAILLVIGLLHGIGIWWGDVLLMYALTGFVLLLFRKRAAKTVGIWAAVTYSLMVLVMLCLAVASLQSGHLPFGDFDAKRAHQQIDAMARQGFASHVRENVREWVAEASYLPFAIPLFVLPRFLAGLWIWRNGIIQNLESYLPTVRRVWRWSAIVSLLSVGGLTAIRYGFRPPLGKPSFWIVPTAVLRELDILSLAVFYAASVTLAVQVPRWKGRLAGFGSVGRMALTNYLAQSAVLVPVFCLSGLYGKAGPAIGLVVTVIFYALQVWASRWWLERYRFGPVEWIWRSLTYGQRQPMRLAEADI